MVRRAVAAPDHRTAAALPRVPRRTAAVAPRRAVAAQASAVLRRAEADRRTRRAATAVAVADADKKHINDSFSNNRNITSQ